MQSHSITAPTRSPELTIHLIEPDAARTACGMLRTVAADLSDKPDETTCIRCLSIWQRWRAEPRLPAFPKPEPIRKAKRPAMTADEARTFEATSAQNAVSVQEQLISDDRCVSLTCEPYVSIFTYKRWQAQGFQVRKGSKAAKATTWVHKKDALGLFVRPVLGFAVRYQVRNPFPATCSIQMYFVVRSRRP